MKHRRSEKGQTALEFTLIAPLLLGAVFLILGVALGWYTHALASTLALEGAAREAVSPGSGFALIEERDVPGELQGGFTNSISEEGRTGKIFSVRGHFHIPLNPLGFDLSADISSGAIAPEWEFAP